MDQLTKDRIDAVSKIAGAGGLFVAIFVAWSTVKKNRDDRKAELTKQMHQKDKELKEARMNTTMLNALFWLEVRKMLSEHDEIHLKPRGQRSQEWSPSSPASFTDEEKEWAKVEAYMGLLEHIMGLRRDGLIDPDTLKNIYAYRVWGSSFWSNISTVCSLVYNIARMGKFPAMG
jgi:hypothetical protein